MTKNISIKNSGGDQIKQLTAFFHINAISWKETFINETKRFFSHFGYTSIPISRSLKKKSPQQAFEFPSFFYNFIF
jgi:hypothetical protein